MKGDQIGIRAADPTPQELPLSNQTRFSAKKVDLAFLRRLIWAKDPNQESHQKKDQPSVESYLVHWGRRSEICALRVSFWFQPTFARWTAHPLTFVGRVTPGTTSEQR